MIGETGDIGAYLDRSLSGRGNIIHVLLSSFEKAKGISFAGVIPFIEDVTDKAMAGCKQVVYFACAKVWVKNTDCFY